jgi:phage major head subunit gpT-like protein
MNINPTTLRALFTSFSTAFQGGFTGVQPMYPRIAQVVPSTTRDQQYGWMKSLPGMREWIGDRVIQNVSTSDYTIKNKPFESTVSVNRDDIEDDNLGVYSGLFTEMGRVAATQPDRMVWPLLTAGFSTPCYDGQFFFDTDHPVVDANGAVQSVSNSGGGSGTPWFLLDTSRFIKPIIFQTRKPFDNIIRRDREEDENVFNRKEFIYGVDGRGNVGYGFWQLAYGSRETLNAANYGAARAAMGSFKKDGGEPLGIVPNLLVVPPSLESAGRKILNSELGSGGETNEWKGTAELMVVPWLG